MATTSSSEDSSFAPKDFQCNISISTDSESRLSPNRTKCPLCRKLRKHFYCKDCIQAGLFYSSRSKVTEGFYDKQRTLHELEENRKALEKNCNKLLENRLICDILHSKIRQVKDRNRILKLAIEEKRQKKIPHNEKLMDLRCKNEKRNRNLPFYDRKVQDTENKVSFHREKVDRTRKSMQEQQEKVKRLTRLRIQQIFKYIFPITSVQPIIDNESSTDSVVNALAEASQTTYIRDRWEYPDFMGELKFCVAGPTLPASGNYSAYNIWAHNHEHVPSSNSSSSVQLNPAFSISAALTYTAQLVSVLAFYLNVRLPYKQVYSDFCSGFMNEQQFARRTARLNANILYLCFTQNVDLNSLHANETIHNILQLLEDNNADLGRQGPMEFDPHKANFLENPLKENLKISGDSDSDDGDSFPVEWEAVPHVQCPEISAGPAVPQTPTMFSTQQASSMAGGLVNSAAASIASFWRGFTGR